ncbi:hypothetical protein B0G75_1201 [Paraburkholderia sp. BL18I3N2]|nr:hypothetical protein B0G75_1201 [Paraburkholderia sp. BL18I3N2]PRX90742.1 hypothetical protein B0G73_14239 [Paraburkholderia sp. BL25I1N1]
MLQERLPTSFRLLLDTSLALPVGQSLKPLTRAALHRIVKDVFSGAADSLRSRGDDHAQRADHLE